MQPNIAPTIASLVEARCRNASLVLWRRAVNAGPGVWQATNATRVLYPGEEETADPGM